MQIVTTLPSATEIVAALGCDPVGVSHGCDFPPRATSIPSITHSRIDADASSGEIDDQVLETTAESDDTGVYDIDTATLEALEPDLIVTQGMCDVCAVDEVIVADAVDEIDADPDVLTTDPHSMADVLDDIERIGRAADREDRARELRADLEARIDRIRERTRAADLSSADRPRVTVFDWTDPVMLAGHWTNELVEWAGGEYGLGARGERSRPREWDEILEYDPECIVVGPCGFDLGQTAANRSDLTGRDGWADLTAVQEGRVWAMDGNHYLNRPGPRLVDTLETLAPIIQPDLFDQSVTPASEGRMAVPFSDLETHASGDGETRVETRP
ncbi:cobalamin-binding protein [Natronolimnobius baerhuensis]|uniref:Cobalamin-binding protein n=1 Tax=Natronolimnobius baerhuensis TaxID=253108 RepID=A0A202E9L1_9EURY|nr:cobalamin-binding protein [Natronolimnobius baerhuensis]OVE84909.1 cobalamin-binding protein [Natronolimnobius baerhuensis]